MVARLTPASPSHALSVPIRSANGSPEEKPNASIVADLRVASAALRSSNPSDVDLPREPLPAIKQNSKQLSRRA